jgi:hypothetical protein
LRVTEWLCVFSVVGVRFVLGTDRYQTWCGVDTCEDEWATRSLQESLVCLDCGIAVSKSDRANLEKVTPLRQNESFKQDKFDKPGHRRL